MKQLIQKLTETFSPSGYENAICEVIREEIKPFVNETRVDALGNLVARKGSRSIAGMRIMLAGHMDEIGLMVTHVDANGFVRFTGLGGIRMTMLTGSRVRFMDGTRGVIGTDRLTDMTKAPTLEQCFVDVGATSPKDCPVKIGDVCAFDRPFIDLGKRLVAKSMDDRIGCAVMVESLRTLKTSPHELYFVFTTQEEVGLRGAGTAAHVIDPDVAFVPDVSLSGDSPDVKAGTGKLGSGPSITVYDGSMIPNRKLRDLVIDTAESSKIPFHFAALERGGTDGGRIHMSRAGVPTLYLGAATRYIHSHTSILHKGDFENLVNLLVEVIKKLDSKAVEALTHKE